MTSLPSAVEQTRQEAPDPAYAADGRFNEDPKAPAPPSPVSLAQAFEAFVHVAGSLEQSYGHLQSEVARLRQELENKNRDLARSLAENQRMRRYLGRILAGLPCGVLVVDRDLRLCFANPEADRMLRANPSDQIEFSTPIPVSLQRVLAEIIFDDPGAERVWMLEAPEGPRSIGVSCALLTENAAAREELVFILRDTTEQKRLQMEREKARRMQALAEMTALLAHEIRNPLGSLELFTGLIAEATGEQPEVSQWVVHLQAGLRALSATVNNVLQFHSQAPLQTIMVNLTRLLDDTLQFLQPLALQQAMGIEFSKPAEEIWLRADPHRLQQVFFNLASNAFRAMSPGGKLRVRVAAEPQQSGGLARVEFEDEGVGIAPENIEKIFQAGYSSNAVHPGLGLAVCKTVVEQHQGSISVASIVGKGTTFTIGLPLLAARQLTEGESTNETRERRRSKALLPACAEQA